MSENETIQVQEPKNQEPETSKAQEAQTKNTPIMTPFEAVQKITKGKIKLFKPIQDGDKVHEELNYDFNELTGWELARAIDGGESRDPFAKNLTDTQALSLFAVAAAKCTEGLDERDIKERLGAMDAITAIRTATLFFNGSLMAGSMNTTNG